MDSGDGDAATTRPNITRFTDFRAFLRDMYTDLKATQRGFSYRAFARRAGFSSGSFLKLVADGKRNLSDESVHMVARGLGLTRMETDAFEALVAFGQAETDAVRHRAWERLAKLSDRDPAARLSHEHFGAYKRWYPWIIRELAALPGFREDATWLGKRLRPAVKPRAAQRALDLLTRLGLLERDADGLLRPAERALTTGPEVRSLAARAFHRRMLEIAIRALDRVPREERNITSVTVTLDRRRYDRVVELLAALRQEVLAAERAPDPDTDPDDPVEVYQLTLCLVPMTQEIAR